MGAEMVASPSTSAARGPGRAAAGTLAAAIDRCGWERRTAAAPLPASGSGRRSYSGMPEPDPEHNPAPSQKVIDIVDAIENLTVKEVVWLCKLQQERFGISDAELGMVPMGAAPAATPAAATAEAPAAEAAPEKTEFDVIIDSYDTPSKIKIIKEVRSVMPELGLKQAKELVRSRTAR